MKFWDTSAIIPLLADEPARERLLAFLEEDPQVVAWWGTTVEIASAEGWHEILPSDAVRPTTLELVCLDTRLTIAARREGFKVHV